MSDGTSTFRSPKRSNASLVISILALVVALMGSAVATASVAKTAAKNSVTSKSIKNGTIKTKDISSSAMTDLNDAATVGGLSVAQLVAAAGGEYVEARQASAASVDIFKKNSAPVNVVTLNIPHAGKWLINANLHAVCTYDGTDGPTPADPSPVEPGSFAQGQLVVDGTLVEAVNASCEAEDGFAVILAPIYSGTAEAHISRMITTTGPATVVLRGTTAPNIVLFIEAPAGNRSTLSASQSYVQAVTVH